MNICNQVLSVSEYNYTYGDISDFSEMPRPKNSIAYIVSGSLDFEYEKQHGTAKAGDIFFVPFGSRYVLRCADKCGAVIQSCHFSSFNLLEPFDGKKFSVQSLCVTEKIGADMHFMLENQQNSELSFEVLRRFYGILADIYPRFDFRIFNSSRRISPAVEFINVNFDKSFSIEGLAKICSMSRSSFFDAFRTQVGMTPVEYKNLICMDRAVDLLLCEREKSIEDISSELGFSSAVYFRRLFKKTMGMSPLKYRKSF